MYSGSEQWAYSRSEDDFPTDRLLWRMLQELSEKRWLRNHMKASYPDFPNLEQAQVRLNFKLKRNRSPFNSRA